ncbi:hypothetical protein HK101_009817 [Irineochytrium annulatum]|nr:hypothetical protein HK101_009817 [Irineochytrium annulatum]
MSVVYLGDTFAETLDAYFVERAPVIFYYWKPTSFVATQNLTRVSLPNDELGLYSKWALGGKKNALAVDYPTDILFKAVSVKFDEEFPDVASLLLNFQMSDSDILDLLRVADARNLTEDETACLWLTENQDKWEQWIPDPPQTLVSCPVGQGLYEIESLMTCISCFSGTYNWNPNNTGTCLPCPQNAKCPGGYHMLVDKGFWMADDFDPTEPVVITPEVYDCPYPETCCPEGGCDAKETCAEGFSGVLCTECSDPSAHLWNGKCMKCDGPGSSFYLILLLSPLVSFAFFLLPSSEMPTFELLFFYFQVINLIFASSLQGTVGFQYLQTLLSIASLDVDGIVTTCPLPIGGLSKQMFRYLLPSLLLFHIGSFYLIYRLLLKVAPTLAKRIADFPSMKWFLGGQDFGLRCLRVFNTMLTWTLMPLVEASLSILDCRSIIGSRLVYLTPTVNCADVDYKGPAAFAIIILVALMAAYPLFISFTLYRVWRGGEFSKDVRRRDKSDGARPENEGDQHSGEARAEHRELMAADIFYEGYKREFFWAEPLMLLERGVIVVCFAIAKSQGADDPTTSYTNICLFCALSVIRIYFQPYRHSFESFLNREICLGWLVATAIRILMLWTGLRASLSILIALTMFSPVALHLMRFARMKVLEARHAEIRDEVMASSVRSLPETTEKEKAIRDVHHEKESIGSALMTE